MKILAIDSSTAPASVAITDNGVVLGEFTININKTHSEKLLLLADNLLDVLSLTVKDMDAFAISIGPGSFTGLRIGMSAAKLMAQTTEKPLLGVKTLEALAKNVSVFDGLICPMLDARNNTVYRAVYECKNGTLSEIAFADAVNIGDCAASLASSGKNVIICGEHEKYHDVILSYAQESNNIRFAPPYTTYQRASVVALIAEKMYNDGIRTAPNDINPFYVRESQAEQARRAKISREKT